MAGLGACHRASSRPAPDNSVAAGLPESDARPVTPLPLPPLPAGLPASWAARRPTADDIPAVHALCAANDEAVLGFTDVSLVDIEADLTAPNADLTRNQAVVVDEDADSRLVLWAWIEDHSAGRTMVDLYLDRMLDDATSDALAAWGWAFVAARAEEIAATRGVDVTTLNAGTNDGDTAAERWVSREGFARARTFWRMGRAVGPDDAFPDPGPGVVVRPFAVEGDAHKRDRRLAYEIHEESFSEHWNFHAASYDAWWTRWQSSAGLDFDLWRIAEVDGVPAGLLIATTQMADEGALFVDTLGTLSTARRRGVGNALLHTSFADARRRGLTHVRLNVDSLNQTGATSLYEAVGMRVEFAIHGWQREIAARVPAAG
ncbi:MAG: GNAT family N-acetyltransferase [Streptosporangiales bacterium]|nr:GNAT family N-acetyltransferase [Streptosporangiales bacterium]